MRNMHDTHATHDTSKQCVVCKMEGGGPVGKQVGQLGKHTIQQVNPCFRARTRVAFSGRRWRFRGKSSRGRGRGGVLRATRAMLPQVRAPAPFARMSRQLPFSVCVCVCVDETKLVCCHF